MSDTESDYVDYADYEGTGVYLSPEDCVEVERAAWLWSAMGLSPGSQELVHQKALARGLPRPKIASYYGLNMETREILRLKKANPEERES